MKNYKTQILLFLCGALLVGISSFTVLFINFRKQAKLQNEILSIENSRIQADSLTANLLLLESDERGFQLTGDRSYLNNYSSIKMSCQDNIESLRKNTSDKNALMIISSLDSLVKLRVANLDSGIVVFTTKGPQAAVDFMELKSKKAIRTQLNLQMNVLKNNFLAQMQSNTTGINKRTRRNVGGLLIVILILIFISLLAARTIKGAQQKMIKNHGKFKEAQRIAKIGSWEWDFASNKMKWSEEQFRIFGEKRGEFALNYEGYLSHLSEEEQKRTRSLIADVLLGKSHYIVEHEIIRKDGSTLLVFEQGTVLYDAAGKATGMFGTTQDISERKKAETELRDTKQKFQSIFDNTADGIYQSTIDGRFIMANPSMAKMFGYNSPKDLISSMVDIGKQLYADPADRKRMSVLLIQQGHIENYEIQLLTRKGEKIWVSESTRAVRNEKGEIICYEGTLKDITERKKVEEELNSSKEQYRQIVETAQEGIWVLDENNFTCFVNKKMCEMLGYSREEMMGKQNFSFRDEEGKGKAIQDIERKKEGEAETQISSFVTKSGKTLYTSVSTNPIFDDNGKYVGALGMFTDITERKKKDKELLVAQKKFQAIFDNTADGIYQSTIDGKFIMANPSMARIFRYDSPADLMSSVTNIGTQIYADPVERKKMSEIIMAEGRVKNYELQVLTKTNETIWVRVNIRAVKDENGMIGCFEGTLEDISERKNAEKEILQLNKNLEQFADITAHDLQEPIRMVSGFLGLLHKKYSDVIDEQGKSYIERAKDGADRMSILIKDLLEFSRSGNKAAKREMVDLSSVLELVHRDMSIAMEDSSASLFIPNSMPVVDGTQSALYRLFLNLVSNGIKFRKKDVHPEVTIQMQELNDSWEFTVQDNGIGVPEKDQPKLFQAFHRLHRKEDYPGTGLGLVTCKKIVETHGGQIWMTSEYGTGTAFHFTLPKMRA